MRIEIKIKSNVQMIYNHIKVYKMATILGTLPLTSVDINLYQTTSNESIDNN